MSASREKKIRQDLAAKGITDPKAIREAEEKDQQHENLLEIVKQTMPEEEELYDLAELFKVFGDSTRIRILFVLFEAEVLI